MPYEEAKKEVDQIMEELDKEEKGMINYSDFLMASLNKQKLLHKNNLLAVFNMFDKVDFFL
jgi:calcium-dependent protein kinase